MLPNHPGGFLRPEEKGLANILRAAIHKGRWGLHYEKKVFKERGRRI